MGITAFASAAVVGLTSLSPTVAPDPADVCAWRHAAVRLYQELAGESQQRAAALRRLLADSGVGEPGFVPAQCRGSEAGSSPRPDETESGTTATSAGAETSAAERYGWGEPNRVAEFDGPLGDTWNVYDGPGHAGNGRRTPSAVSISDGVLTINGDAQGSTAGMAWMPGQKYGRWEGRVRAPASDETYNALLLLWPDAENFPVGGEIDFMEMMDHTRQTTELFLHYGEDNSQVHGEIEVDGSQWHNWAVEWTREKITAFVDGEEWWSTTDTSIFPPGPMHLCIQLDWFPDNGDGSVKPSAMHVDWVKQYPLGTGEGPSTTGDGSEGSTTADSSTTITDEINSGQQAGGAGDASDAQSSSDSSDAADSTDNAESGDDTGSSESSSPPDDSGSSDS